MKFKSTTSAALILILLLFKDVSSSLRNLSNTKIVKKPITQSASVLSKNAYAYGTFTAQINPPDQSGVGQVFGIGFAGKLPNVYEGFV